MGKTLKRSYLALVLLLAVFITMSTCRIMMIYQIGRHGLRSSKLNFHGLVEEDQYEFKIGNFSLTKAGLQQTYQRGLSIMSRYRNFLKDINLSQVRVRASNTTRTILSSYSQLLGMFGSNVCRDNIEKYTRNGLTTELNSLKDIETDVAR